MPRKVNLRLRVFCLEHLIQRICCFLALFHLLVIPFCPALLPRWIRGLIRTWSPLGRPAPRFLLAARGSLAHLKLPQLITSLSHRSTPGSPAPSGPWPSHGSPGGLPDQLQLLKPAVAASSLISSSFSSSPPLPSPLILSSPANTDHRC